MRHRRQIIAKLFVLLPALLVLGSTGRTENKRHQPCSPFREDEIFLRSNMYNTNDTCHVVSRIHACVSLQARDLIPSWFNCTERAPKYVSAVAIVLHLRWEGLSERGLFRLSQSDGILKACASNESLGCADCRSLFLRQEIVDVRLEERDFTPLSIYCKDSSVGNMYELFKQMSSNFLNYNTVLKLHSVNTAFKGPLCFPQHYCEPLKAAVEHLRSISRRTGCLNTTCSTDILQSRTYESGLGSSIHVTAHDALVASYVNASYFLSPDQNFTWADRRDCDPPTLRCYYKPIGIGPNKPGTMHGTYESANQNAVTYTRSRLDPSMYLENTNGTEIKLERMYGHFVELALRKAKCFGDSLCSESKRHFSRSAETLQKQFARAATVNFFQGYLNDWITAHVEEAVRDMDIPHPVVSIHVRRGDKHKEMRLLDLDDHLRHALPLMLAFGVKNIFLSTEDPEVIQRAVTAFPAINWYFTNDERHNPNFSQFMKSNRTNEFLLAMRNLHIAAKCDFFIGARASNWCRLIDETQRFNGLGGTYYIDAHGNLEESGAYTNW
eukprot:CAMPEP_0179719174 /NCGR_PEP_ID=MMETSP0938-20121108/3290_1 /TAXON_ID=548131 ORGANISM="Ostreococcus mediterraneus, Strain clade-D-RCC1107" /NCGR_SAMPLE_ID=MMETSP0938 /ASSEMBLY_ACC=CAM_ASM_000576 /LENGTH=552 /DNA_ID=CAMNT_0021593003 /DNA_START=420 /DNA_END=2078 /DNA_ORIENTATION=-